MNVRHGAVLGILEVLSGKSLKEVLPALRGKAIPEKDWPLLQELTFGLCRWHTKLQKLLSLLVKKPLKEKDKDIEILLHLGLYQLLFLNIPPHAAIHETVNVTTTLKKMWAKGFVNGVLREFQREKDSLLLTLDKDEEAMLSHPHWLFEKVKQNWPQHFREILTNNNEKPPMTLRVNEYKISREKYLTLLQEKNITATPCVFSSAGLTLQTPQDAKSLPGFHDGFVSVQDEAAQLAAFLLELKPEQRVLDACCAPGGKLMHIMEKEPNLKQVVGIDKDENRLKQVQENLHRLQFSPQLVTADAKTYAKNWDGIPFQRILADVPCSASGVIRRHPDIKLLRKTTDFPTLMKEQLTILQALWPLLAEDGILLYATCSIFMEENEEVLGKFLANQTDAVCIPLESSFGISLKYGTQILPGMQGMDGFYYGKLKKTP